MYPQRFLASVPAFPQGLTVFVIMSFDPRFDYRWREVIQPTVGSVHVGGHALTAYRTNASVIGDSILTDILANISTARLIVCDLTSLGQLDHRPVRNGNVMYELGIAHAVRQPEEVILFRSDDEPLLFDISRVRVNTYRPDQEPAAAREALRQAMVTGLREVEAARMLSVQHACNSLDAIAWDLLIGSEDAGGVVMQPSRATVGEVLVNSARIAAIQRMLELRVLQAEFARAEFQSVAQMSETTTNSSSMKDLVAAARESHSHSRACRALINRFTAALTSGGGGAGRQSHCR